MNRFTMKFARATLATTVLACAALAALAGCLDDPGLDLTPAVATESDPLVTGRQRHCIAEAVALHTPDDPIREAAPPRCFESFADAIFVATNGALRIGDDVTPEDLTRMDVNQHPGLDTYLIAIEYDWPRWDTSWGAASLTFYSDLSCNDVWSLYKSNLAEITGWNDRISSVHTFPGCVHGYHYDHANFAGAVLDCHDNTINGHDPCYYSMGALDNRTSSIQWTNFF